MFKRLMEKRVMKKIYLSLLLFLFLLPGEVLAACANSINFNTNVPGNWESSCTSVHRPGAYAKYYTFSLSSSQTVTIDLQSSTDTYLFLLNGSGQNGTVIAENDDSNSTFNSQIILTLPAGTYTVEATTFDPSSTGNFVVSVRGPTLPSGDCVNTNSGLSGLWYDPLLDGEGYNIIISCDTTVFFFYGYDSIGQQLWLISETLAGAPLIGQTVKLKMFVAIGGTFDKPEPSSQALTEWGKLEVEFSQCTQALANLTGTDGQKTSNLIKLVGIANSICP